MKYNTNNTYLTRLMAGILAFVVFFTGVTGTSTVTVAAATAPGAVAKITTKGYTSSDGDSKGIKFSWTKVSGANGYQYSYDLFWGTKNSKEKKGLTTKKSIKIGFQDHETIRFKVRAYKNTKKNGKTKKVFGNWVTKTLTAGQVDKLFETNGSTGSGSSGSTTSDNTGTAGISGSWKDSSKNTTMSCREISGGVYQIDIEWKSSAITGTRWAFYGMFIGTSGIMELSNGTKESITYNANGEIVSVQTMETGLTGSMTYDADKKTITWNGSVAFTGFDSDLVFK